MIVTAATNPADFDRVTLSHKELHEAVTAYVQERLGRQPRRLIEIDAVRIDVMGVQRYAAVHITYELEPEKK